MYQPFIAGMRATGPLKNYNSGILTEDFLHCSDPFYLTNHSILVVGFGHNDKKYGSSGMCNEYWIIRNSWGANWGEDGFMKICADNVPGGTYGTCLLNELAIWPIRDVNNADFYIKLTE